MGPGRHSALAVCLVAALAAGGIASAAGPKLNVRAAKLTKTGATTWTGAIVSSQLGKGRLTLTGNITFDDKSLIDPRSDRSTARFSARFNRGTLRGCFVIEMYLRPRNRQVWEGGGRVTSTSAPLMRYRGLKLAVGGLSPADNPTFAKPFRFDDLSERKAVC